jgi:hypothetical protein
MSAPREACFEALFAIIEGLVAATGDEPSTARPLRVASRALRSWDDVGPGECPAAFLVAAGEQRQNRPGFPSLITLTATLVIYVKNVDGRENVPSTAVNAIISAIEDALQRQPTDGPVPAALFPVVQGWGTTLGGLCYTCSIDQSLEIFEGFIGVDTAAQIPIVMLTSDR